MNDDERICRIFNSDNQDNLISPCRCKGLQNLHKECIMNWINIMIRKM